MILGHALTFVVERVVYRILDATSVKLWHIAQELRLPSYSKSIATFPEDMYEKRGRNLQTLLCPSLYINAGNALEAPACAYAYAMDCSSFSVPKENVLQQRGKKEIESTILDYVPYEGRHRVYHHD